MNASQGPVLQAGAKPPEPKLPPKDLPPGTCAAEGGETPKKTNPSRMPALAWLPIPLLAIAILAARSSGLSASYQNETVRMVLSFTLSTVMSLGALVLIGRSFLASGSPGLLLSGCGVLLWSLAGPAGDLISHGDVNLNVTIANTGMLLAGLCHLGGASLSLSRQRGLSLPRIWLVGGYGMALCAMALVADAALHGWFPVFFAAGQGGSTVRYCVLSAAVFMFVLSAGLLMTGNTAVRPRFTSWYALALLLIGVGMFGVMIQRSMWDVVNWLGRVAQWCGGVYLFLGALAALQESNLALFPVETRPAPRRYRYGVAVAIVLGAAAIRAAFLPELGKQAVFVTFYPAVMLAALYGGWRPGLVATALSGFLAGYFWFPSQNLFIPENSAAWLGMVLFLVSGGMVSWITEGMQRARLRAVEAESEARLAESETRYRHLFQNMAEEVHYWKVERDGTGQICTWRLVDVNPPALQSWGKASAEELRGKTTDEIFGAGATEHYLPIVRKVISEGRPETYEDYFPHLGKHFRFTSVPLGEYFITTGADITRSKKSEEQLIERDRRFTSLLSNLHSGVALVDENGRFAIYNAAFLELFGLTSEVGDINDQNWERWQVFDENGRLLPLAEHPVRKAALSGQCVRDNLVRVRRPSDERDVWLLISAQPIMKPDGRLHSLICTYYDVTARREAEAAVKKTQEQLRFALEACHIGTWNLDLDNHSASRTLEHDRIFGYTQLLPKWTYEMFLEHVLSEDRAMVSGKFRQATETRTEWSFECRIRRVDGQVRWIWAAGRHEREETREPRRIVGIVQDITERKAAEEALRESEFKYRTVADNTNDWEFWIDEQGQFRYNSPSCEVVTGRKREEFMADADLRRRQIHPDDQGSYAAHIDEVENKRVAGQGEWRLIHPDGSVRWVTHFCRPVYGENGKFLGIRGSNRDITDQKRANQRTDILAETANRLLRADAPQHVVNELCQHVMAFLDCQVFFNFLVDEREGGLRLNACGGISVEEARKIDRLEYGVAVCGCAARDGCRIVAENIATTTDPRTELVKGYGVEAYACHPLIVQGRVLGTLSFGTKNRTTFTGDELSLMKAVADQVAIAMERQHAQNALRESNLRLEARVAERTAELHASSRYARSLIEANLDALVTISAEGKITDVNRATEAVTGVGRAELIGRKFSDFFTEPAQAEAGYQKVLAEGMVQDYPLVIRHRSGHTTDVLYNATLYRSEAGREQGVLASARDVTQRLRAEAELARYRDHLEDLVRLRTAELETANSQLHREITDRTRAEKSLQASLREKEVMLREIHHRVKNNMQVISSLVNLQADAMDDTAMSEPLNEIRDRVRSMALVHEKLYQSESLAAVDFAEYTSSLLNYLWHAHGTKATGVRLSVDLKPVLLPVDLAVPCGLLLNELATNALKHAFRGRPGGVLSLSLHEGPDGRVCLAVSDDGLGLPPGLNWRNTRSMGLQLVDMLTKQLKASVKVSGSGGTSFEIEFAQPQTRGAGEERLAHG